MILKIRMEEYVHILMKLGISTPYTYSLGSPLAVDAVAVPMSEEIFPTCSLQVACRPGWL